MLELTASLRRAWVTTLGELGVDGTGPVLVGGPLAERIGAAVPWAIADEVDGLVVLGDGPVLDPGSAVTATGLPSASMESVFMLEAWPSPGGINEVVDEALRIVRPGGAVWLGRVDVDALVNATVATRLSALLYRRHAGRFHDYLDRGVVAPTEMALIRGGLRPVQSWHVELPLAAFADAGAYLAAVTDGMWFGIDLVSPAERKGVMADLTTELERASFPLVEYQPWVVAQGTKLS